MQLKVAPNLLNSLGCRMDSNGNEFSSARDMEGEENPSHQTVENGENNNYRKGALEGFVSNEPMKRFKVMSTEDQLKWLSPAEMAEYIFKHSFLKKKCMIQS